MAEWMDAAGFQAIWSAPIRSRSDSEEHPYRVRSGARQVAKRPIGDPEREAVEAFLLERAEDRSPLAFDALAELGAERFRDVFAEAARSGGRARLHAAKALRQAGDVDGARAAIVEMLARRGSWSVGIDVAMAAADYSGPEIESALWQAVNHPDYLVRHHAFRSLLQVTGRIESRRLVPPELDALSSFATHELGAVRTATRAAIEADALEPYAGPLSISRDDVSPVFQRFSESIRAGEVDRGALEALAGAERRWALYIITSRMAKSLGPRDRYDWLVGGPSALVWLAPPWLRAALEELWALSAERGDDEARGEVAAALRELNG